MSDSVGNINYPTLNLVNAVTEPPGILISDQFLINSVENIRVIAFRTQS
jgi:hypothetical protein